MKASPVVKLTYDDFLRFPDDGMRHELIDGSHYVTPSPSIRHQTISGRLFALIWVYLDTHAIGQVFHAPLDVVLSDTDVVEPDILYVSNLRAPSVITPLHARGAPDLVAEIASKSTRRRDETIKLRLYERDGVTEYWVVDPHLDVVRVYRREGDSFARPIELTRTAGDVLTTPLLPGLELPLERILREP
jgi:Uma2 family endonuclease